MKLAKQALLGIVRFKLLFALLLFLPAWSISFWQAWLYWTLMTAAGLGMALYFLKHNPALIARRLEVGPGAEAQRSQQIIQTIASVAGCSVFVLAALDHRFRWSAVPVPIVLVAEAIVMLGMLIVFRTLQENSFTAGAVRVEENQPLISTGPYAWVRHPMYAGAVLTYLATPLALGSL
jgi:protein-S-isoprenylcysteine O-methyltransferase Ste14